MTTNEFGKPMIVTYWRPSGTQVPQYHVIHLENNLWKVTQVSQRTTTFSLSGGGTKAIPISRPKIFTKQGRTYVIFSDEERGRGISAAYTTNMQDWNVFDLTTDNLGFWEPTYDRNLWAREGVLSLFMQKVDQGDGGTLGNLPPQMVRVLEWAPQ